MWWNESQRNLLALGIVLLLPTTGKSLHPIVKSKFEAIIHVEQSGRGSIPLQSKFKLQVSCSPELNYRFCFAVLAIKCWDCRSDADPKCSDPFDNTTFSITDCKQEPFLEHLGNIPSTMCRKIRQKCMSF